MAAKISRQAYAEMFGPTTGDRLRLADTELWLEVEKDFTSYGDEVKFGGGKVIRDGDWKLVLQGKGKNKPALFNLKNDLGEMNDLAGKESGRVKSMKAAAEAWLKEVNGSAPAQPKTPPVE